jgi:hypothetical protein
VPARHKGIHTDSFLDRYWPFHAVIPWENCCEAAYHRAHKRAKELGCAERQAYAGGLASRMVIFRFTSQEAAETFSREFGGRETYDATDRSKGGGWWRWRRKTKAREAWPTPPSSRPRGFGTRSTSTGFEAWPVPYIPAGGPDPQTPTIPSGASGAPEKN